MATVEFVNARAAAIGVTADTELQRSAEATGRPEPRQVRSVFFEESGGFVDTPIYARGSLGKDTRLAGPAIVEQDDTTLLLPPGTSLEVDQYLNILIDVASGSGAESTAGAGQPAAQGA